MKLLKAFFIAKIYINKKNPFQTEIKPDKSALNKILN